MANQLGFTREELLTADDVAEIPRVRRASALDYMRRGVIHARKIGRLWYSPRSLLVEHLTSLFEDDWAARSSSSEKISPRQWAAGASAGIAHLDLPPVGRKGPAFLLAGRTPPCTGVPRAVQCLSPKSGTMLPVRDRSRVRLATSDFA
ncbi:MAG TPA: helix-turn-helix domain-containing protein [Solirubrobacterales bacterium]|nr:helix-turn-helix domain-containing protein [Solirubrobacterales bacterium]